MSSPGEYLLDKAGVKYDKDKLRYDLVPAYPMEQLAEVYTFGARKYSEWNWVKGIKYSRLIAALFRHFWAFVRGEDIDPESGLPHLAHALWNITSLLYFSKYRPDLDDRQLVRKESRGPNNSFGPKIQMEGVNCCIQNTPVRDPSKTYLPDDGEIRDSKY
jgi:hypothetical protein